MDRARCAESPTDRRTPLLALFRVLRDPEDDGHGIGRGGGGGHGRGPETTKHPTGRPGQQGQGRAERPQKYSSVRMEGIGTRTVVQGKEEGVEGHRRRLPPQLSRVPRRVNRCSVP